MPFLIETLRTPTAMCYFNSTCVRVKVLYRFISTSTFLIQVETQLLCRRLLHTLNMPHAHVHEVNPLGCLCFNRKKKRKCKKRMSIKLQKTLLPFKCTSKEGFKTLSRLFKSGCGATGTYRWCQRSGNLLQAVQLEASGLQLSHHKKTNKTPPS